MINEDLMEQLFNEEITMQIDNCKSEKSYEDTEEKILDITNDIIVNANTYGTDLYKKKEIFNSFGFKDKDIFEVLCELIRKQILISDAIHEIRVANYDWYKNKKNCSWDNYSNYIESEKGFSYDAVISMDMTTNIIMNSIKNPNHDEKISQKGLVIGDIQSGKTAHFMGLMAKCIDSNFDIIIILTGIANELRSQTQRRIEYDLIGRTKNLSSDTMFENVGIKLARPGYECNAYMCTSIEEDIKSQNAKDIENLKENTPAIFITKKNGSTLKNLYKILNSCQAFFKMS